MDKICEDHKCSGCGLCVAKCPKSAISLNVVGLHYRPVIDKKKCIDCGVCRKACPNNSQIKLNPNLACYAAWSLDEYDHFESTSGGIATTLGKKFVQNGDYVAGCAWDENFKATTIVTNDISKLERIRKSKYVHNFFSKEAYQQILDLLKKGKKVLFVGVPCQCEAIKRYVGGRDSGLYVVDVLCRGAASPKLFCEYISTIKKDADICNVTFRGGKYNCRLCVWKNDRELMYSGEQFRDPYFWSFMRHTIFRKSCFSCPFATDKRVGDLTLADFWGLKQEIVDSNDLLRRGVNLVLVHTDKGKELLSMVKGDIFLLERPVEEGVNGNETLQQPTPKPFQYDILNKIFACIGVKKGVLLDLLYLKDALLPVLKSRIRPLLPDVVVDIIKGRKR